MPESGLRATNLCQVALLVPIAGAPLDCEWGGEGGFSALSSTSSRKRVCSLQTHTPSRPAAAPILTPAARPSRIWGPHVSGQACVRSRGLALQSLLDFPNWTRGAQLNPPNPCRHLPRWRMAYASRRGDSLPPASPGCVIGRDERGLDDIGIVGTDVLCPIDWFPSQGR